MQTADATSLAELIKEELSTLRLEHWEYFFPVEAATWRFIEKARPGALPPLDAGFSEGEPYFAGKGAEWFLNTLFNREDVLALVEKIMYPAFDKLPLGARDRGYLRGQEVPAWWERAIDPKVIEQLASIVLANVDDARAAGLIGGDT